MASEAVDPALPPVAPPPPPAQAGLATFSVPRVLHHLAADRSIVFHADMELAKQSPSFPIVEHFLLNEYSQEMTEIETKCGFSPLEVWTTLTVAWKESPDNDGILLAITGDVNEAQISTCFAALGRPDDEAKLKQSYWPDSNMMLYQKGSDAETLEHEVDQGSLMDNPNFTIKLSDLRDPYASIWAIGILPDSMRSAAGMIGMGVVAPTSFSLQVNLERGLDSTIALQFASASDASATQQAIKQALPMVSSMAPSGYQSLIKGIQLDMQDTIITLSLQLSQVEVEDLLKTL